MKPNRTESENQGGKWLLTFNDMVTLLLTFFVLILSMSSLDKSKLEEAASSMRTVFDLSERGTREEVAVFTPFVLPVKKAPPTDEAALAFEREKDDLAERINREAQRIAAKRSEERGFVAPGEDLLSWEGIMEARVMADGVSVALGEKLLFETGKVEISEGNQPALQVLCSLLRGIDCRIQVAGNTDEVPINNGRFPSNWELSVARAVSVINYFISEGSILPKRLSAAGYADSRPRFPAVNDRNRELNRRVEVLLILNRDGGGRGNG